MQKHILLFIKRCYNIITTKTYDEIKKQLSSIYIELPNYIDEFISNIDFEIQLSKGKTNKEKILKNYDNNDYYSEKIEEKLDINVKRYLAIKIVDDDDDDNDDNDENN